MVMSKIFDMKIHPEEVMEDLEEHLKDSRDRSDEDFWYDRYGWVLSNFEHYEDEYKSTDDDDRDNIYHTDLETISHLINCVVRFGRIPIVDRDEKSYRFGDVINFPKGDIPRFYTEDGYETDKKHNTITTNMEKNK